MKGKGKVLSQADAHLPWQRRVIPDHDHDQRRHTHILQGLGARAPTSDALQKFSMEPEIVKWMAWNTSEIKLAMSLEESMKLLEQTK